MLNEVKSRILSGKKFIFTLAFVLIVHCTFSIDNCISQQSAWYAQQTGTTQTLWGIFFINEYTGWAVGGGGTLLKTTNGGDNWIQYSTSTTNQLYSIQFINPQTGFLTGFSGTFKKSTNGGLNWQTINTGNQVNLWQCFFLNSEIGCIATDNSIMRSINGGLNWIYSIQTSYYYGIYFYNANYGWTIAGNGQTYITTNCGINWIATSYNPNGGGIGFSFVNLNTGWTVGYQNSIYKTTNGGYTWDFHQVNPMTGPILRSVCFPDTTGQKGWVAGDNGVFIKTYNSGNNWIIENVNHSIDYKCVVFTGQNKGWVSGSNGTILHTTTGGETIPLAPTLIYPPNNSNNISHTPTLDWQDASSANGYNIQISTLPNFAVILDSSTVSVSEYTVPQGKLNSATTYFWRAKAFNSNGTSSWSDVWNFSTVTGLIPPLLISPVNGAIQVILTPILNWSSVAGTTGYTVHISVSSSFSTITDSATITSTTYNIPPGKLSSSNTYYWRVCAVDLNGQGEWSAVWHFSTVAPPAAPELVSPLNGTIGGTLTPTFIWNPVPNTSSYRFQISRISNFNQITDSLTLADTQYTIGYGKLSNLLTYFWRVCAINQYGTGNWSTIWSYSALLTGITQNDKDIPKEYKLYNNYPNPFNPTTNVQFSIINVQYVTLKVFDILGRNVATLVNEQLQPGKYEVTFDGSNLTSGVYFYRLQSGEFTDVKKLVLLK